VIPVEISVLRKKASLITKTVMRMVYQGSRLSTKVPHLQQGSVGAISRAQLERSPKRNSPT